MKKNRKSLIRAVSGALSLSLALIVMVGTLTGCSKNKSFDYQFSSPKEGDTIAVLHTSEGDITMRLFPDEAPKAVENFVEHAKAGYYDGMEFFRVLDDFMIQTGDPTGSGKGGESIWGKDFEDEIVDYLSPYYGAVCMANYGAYTGTNGSQFFIVTSKDTDTTKAEAANEEAAKAERVDQKKLDMYKKVGGAMWLDAQIGTLYETKFAYTASTHTVFAQVLDGMEVAEKIAASKVYTKEQENNAKLDDPEETKILENKPVEPIIIESVEILSYTPEMNLSFTIPAQGTQAPESSSDSEASGN